MNRLRNQMTPQAQREIEEGFELKREAIELLGLIAAEFKSDPTSVQCFDRRIVERTQYVTQRLAQLPEWG